MPGSLGSGVLALGCTAALWLATLWPIATVDTAAVVISGKAQTVHVYNQTSHATTVVLLSSGDLGWAGFVTELAEFLASQGVAVVGFNTRAYLASFTSGSRTLPPAQIPGDYATLARTAQRLVGVSSRPVLAGISEGAGLSVIAAAADQRQTTYAGVIAIGLPQSIELGWKPWRDWTIWITKKDPGEPEQDVTGFMPRVSPLPVVLIQSTNDEFVPRSETEQLFAAAGEPKRIHWIAASNHRFSDRRSEVNETLVQALRWVCSLDR